MKANSKRRSRTEDSNGLLRLGSDFDADELIKGFFPTCLISRGLEGIQQRSCTKLLFEVQIQPGGKPFKLQEWKWNTLTRLSSRSRLFTSTVLPIEETERTLGKEIGSSSLGSN